MSYTEKIVNGFPSELTGENIDSLPNDLGRKLAAAVKGQYNSDGKLSMEGKNKLNKIIDDNPSVVNDIMKLTFDCNSNSLLDDYLPIFNLNPSFKFR